MQNKNTIKQLIVLFAFRAGQTQLVLISVQADGLNTRQNN